MILVQLLFDMPYEKNKEKYKKIGTDDDCAESQTLKQLF